MTKDDKKSILVIDDDITVRKLIGYHLKNNNYNVFEATGTDGAFDVLSKGIKVMSFS